MRARHIRQRLNKHPAPVQALSALDARAALLVRLVDDLLVELEEGLDVVGGEGDGNQDHVLVALFHVRGDGVGGLRAEPGGGADLRLPAEAVGVLETEACEDGVDGGGDFGGVGVAWRVGEGLMGMSGCGKGRG